MKMPEDLAREIDPDLVLAYQSALPFSHSLAPRLVCAFADRELHEKDPETGCIFHFYIDDIGREVEVGRHGLATTREQTFVDCVAHPERALGMENVIRSVADMEVDPEHALTLAAKEGDGAVRRVGSVLDLMGAKYDRDKWRATLGADSLETICLNPKGGIEWLYILMPHWNVFVPYEAPRWIEE